MPDAYPDLYRFPGTVWNRIREAVPVRGVWMEAEPGISLFVYDDDTVIPYVYVMDGAQRQYVYLHAEHATELVTQSGKQIKPVRCSGGEAVFELEVIPGRYVLYRIVR